MKIEYLQEFLILAQIRNYTLAAEMLYVSESTLSRHILSLERELHVPLFNRDSKGLTLTEAGSLLMPYARKVLSTLKEYDKKLESAHLVPQKLTVGFVHAVKDYGLLDPLYQFKREHSDMELSLVEDKSETLWQMVSQGECDFIITLSYRFPERKGLLSLPLVFDRLALAVPDSHPLASMGEVRMEQLQEEHFVLPGRSTSLCRFCLQLMRDAGYEPQNVTFAGSLCLDMVSQGLGITIVEEKRYRPAGMEHIAFVPISPTLERPLLLVYRDRALNEQCQTFLDFAESHLTEQS